MLKKILIWDLAIRLFHIFLILSVFFMVYSGIKGGGLMAYHIKCGLFLFGLIVFRILWGFIGSDTAKFSQFIKGPKEIIRYLKGDLTENEQPGHNPLGALMVIALIFTVFLQTMTGLFTPDLNSYRYDGYLSKFLTDENAGSIMHRIHTNLFIVIIIFAAVHILVVLFYKYIKKHDLIKPMITGYKYLNEPLPLIKIVPMRIALLLILTIALSIFLFKVLFL